MARIIRKSVDTSIEQNILTASIISTHFIEEIYPLYNPQYFTNSFVKQVMNWVLDYFDQFGEAPKQHIQDIFTIEKQTLEDAEIEIIQTFLENLSARYVDNQGINDEYILDQAIQYFRKREVEVRVNNAQALLQIGKLDKAEEELTKMKKVMKLTSNWVNPFESESINHVFDERHGGILTFPGELGKLLGPLERGWFVAWLAPFKRGKCLAEGSLVTMFDGSKKRIETISKEDIVLSMDSEYSITPNKVTGVLNQGVKDVYKVTTYTGREVIVTKNHPFYGAKGWTKLEDLQVGNHVAVPKVYNYEGANIYFKYKLRLLAYLIADGCLRGGYTYTKNDVDTMNDFKKCVSLMGDCTSDMKTSLASTCRIGNKGKGHKGLPNTVKWLISLGLDNKLSKEKEIPNFIFNLNNDCLATFLSALFTGDGSVWKDRNNLLIDYSSSSKVMIYQIQTLLLRFGIISVVKYKNVNGFDSWELIISDSCNTNKFLSQIGFKFRKASRAKEILDSLEPKRCQKSRIDAVPFEVITELIPYEQRWKSNTVGQCYKKEGSISNTKMKEVCSYYPNNSKLKSLTEGDILFDKIVDITYLGKKQTYDISVENEYNFIANDIIVHNSFMLQEAVVIAAISGLKAVFISLEMQPKALNERIYKRITAYGEAEKQHLIPVFDCMNNQLGKCSFPECKGSNDALAEDKEHIPEYNPELNHRVCTRCKNLHQGQYELATWFEPVEKPEFSRKNVDKKLKSFTRMYGDNIRIKCYPKFSAGVSDIKRDLDILEQTEGFIPDVIAVDYVGILKVENGGKDHKGLDDSWKSLAALFAERRVVGFSASQGTRGGLHKDTLSSEDIAEWIGSLGHVDIFGAINQTKQEKLRGIIRLGLFAHRHQNFNEEEQITVLQALSLGQVHLDSY